MRKILFFLKKTQKKVTTKRSDRKIDIKKEAESNLKQYGKTFRDLARYDRRERIFN